MKMTEDKIIDFISRRPIIFNGKIHQIIAHSVRRYIATRLAAVRRPCMRETNSPAGMNRGIQTLGEATSEQSAQHTERPWQPPHSIAMLEQKPLAIHLRDHYAVVHPEPYLARQIIENPDVMIALEPHYLDTVVSKTRQLTEKPDITARHHVAILPPIVKYISKKV